MEQKDIIEQFDYFSTYCNFTLSGFLDSLGLTDPEIHVLAILAEQDDLDHKGFIPQFYLESLVEEEMHVSPYSALRTLYKLKELRIIYYQMSEESGHRVINTPAHLVDASMERARAVAEDVEPEEEEGAKRYMSIGQEVKRKKQFDRYAILNIEYPVVYYCLKEEGLLQNKDLEAEIPLFYAAIRKGNLANILIKSGYTPILEFLNYMQSLVNQPLSTPVAPQTDPEGSTTEDPDQKVLEWLERTNKRNADSIGDVDGQNQAQSE